MLSFEVWVVAGVVAIVIMLVLWLFICRVRIKHAERPRLRISELQLPVEDWRSLVPPEWQTEETERLCE
jgi:hypothetical protein